MRNRIVAVLAILFLITTPAYSVTDIYHEPDNGLLGTMQRMNKGQVTFSRLANVLSAVMEDNSIHENELRKLRPGRKIFIADRYLDPSFKVPRSVVRESIRILGDGAGRKRAGSHFVRNRPAQRPADSVTPLVIMSNELLGEALQRIKESDEAAALNRKDYEKRIAELTSRIEAQEANARSLANSHRTVVQALEQRNIHALARAQKAEAELRDRQTSVPGLLVQKTADFPLLSMLFWLILGAVAMFCLVWIYRMVYFPDTHFIRPLKVFEKGPDGTKFEFSWEEEYGGYTCKLCKLKGIPTDQGGREQGFGIKQENLSKHLLHSRNHSDIRVIGLSRVQ